MSMRVATFALSDQMITAALRAQAKMADLQLQESSGIKSSDVAAYGSSSQRIVNLQASVSRAGSYVDAATITSSKVEVMYSTLGSVTDLITSLRSQLTAASTGTATESASAISSAQQLLDQMGALLNTQYGGEYVFGGGRTATAPVDLDTYSAAAGDATTADTSYYLGDDEIASVRVGDDQTVSYGITAGDPAFEKTLRVLRFVANSTSLSSSDISTALDLAGEALDAVSVVQSRLSNAASRIETASAQQTEFKDYAQSLASDLTDVDVAAVTARVSTYQSQLTASYAAISKIQSLNLASYLS
jgi:flagellar hook-associated protein 3 FlgL